MAAEYFEIAKTSERGTRTLLRMYHNFKNTVLLKESFDDKTQLWHTKNSLFIPVNYIEPMFEYEKQNVFFSTNKNARKIVRTRRVSVCSSTLRMYYSHSNKQAGCEKIGKANKKTFCGLQSWLHWNLGESIGQLEEVEQKSGFWNLDQSPSEETKTPESLPLLANNFSGDVSINETPPLS